MISGLSLAVVMAIGLALFGIISFFTHHVLTFCLNFWRDFVYTAINNIFGLQIGLYVNLLAAPIVVALLFAFYVGFSSNQNEGEDKDEDKIIEEIIEYAKYVKSEDHKEEHDLGGSEIDLIDCPICNVDVLEIAIRTALQKGRK